MSGIRRHPFGRQSLFKPLDHPPSLMKWHCSPHIKSAEEKRVPAKCFEDENHNANPSKVSPWGWKQRLFLLHHESPQMTLQKTSSPDRKAGETVVTGFYWICQAN